MGTPDNTPGRPHPERPPAPLGGRTEALDTGDPHPGATPDESLTLGHEPAAFGRYEVRRPLGRGAFGAVFLGYDAQLDRPVAIKAPRLDVDSQNAERAFFEEAKRLAKLNHPGIVSVYDVGIDRGQCYIVSRYLDGPSLSQWLQDNRPTWQQTVQIVAALAEALAHAHAQRIVHRDLKPANVIMTPGNVPVVVDFGLALSDAQLTGRERGRVAGTPAYMSPEQVRGEGHRIDGRTDIFALGVILYRMLTRQMPFQAENTHELRRQIEEDDPQPPRQLVPDLPRELERVCLKALAKSPRHRFTTAGDMAAELLALVGGPRVESLTTADHPAADHPGSSAGAAPDPGPPEPSPVPALAPSGAESAAASGPLAGRSSANRPREASRRRVTLVLCGCDVFTAEHTAGALELEEQQEVLAAFQQACREAAAECGGTVLKATTDGLLVCFGFPLAAEDASVRAVRCGRRALDRLEALNARLEARYRVRLAGHAAVHCDRAIVQDKGPDGPSVVGQVLTVVEQLGAHAAPGAVVVTDDAQKLVRGAFVLEALGPRALRGAGAKELFRVTAERPGVSRVEADAATLTPLVGRDLEVGLLQERWEQATEGMGQVVLLIGEAGLGKSRLVHTLKEYVRGASNLRSGSGTPRPAPAIVEWRAAAQYQTSSLHPAIDHFERLCGFERGDPPAARLDKLRDKLAPLGADSDEAVGLMAALLSVPAGDRYPPPNLDPQRQKERTLDLLADLLRELSRTRPVLFVLEDLHWVDPTTLEFLERFVAQGLNDSILTLLTFRPDFVTPWPSMAHQSQIALNRLTRRQIGELVAAKAGGTAVPQRVIDQIAARTDGVPLFVEEFTRMALEAGADADGSGSSSGSARAREVPATLQDLLAARLDRIDANAEVAQLGAAVGREFPLELIAAAAPFPPAELHAELDKLVAAEVLVARGRPPRTTYTFRHALIQDAAYGSLVKQRRQEFHQRIAAALEAKFPDLVATQPEVLALHHTEAGAAAPAVGYWDRAGRRSLDRGAHKEAVEHFRRALELVPALPDTPARARQEVDLLVALGVPLQATIGYSAPEVERTYTRAHELCARLGLSVEQFPVLYGMFRYYMLQAKYPKARELSGQLLELAERAPEPHFVVAANRARGGPPVYEGRHAEALPFLNRVAAVEPTPDLRAAVNRYDVVDPWVAARGYLAWATWLLGRPDAALRHSEESLRLAGELRHTFCTAFALCFAQWVHQFRGDVARTRAAAEQALAFSREHGFAFWYGWCEVLRGWALAQQGQAEEGVAAIRKGIADWRAQGSELGSHYYYVLLAEAALKARQYDGAAAALDTGARFAADTGEGFFVPEIARLRGKLALKRDPAATGEAERHYRAALELARAQQARGLELRAARSLARVLHARGDTAAARAELEPVYAAFDEGFDTYDLKEAKRLLEALG